MRLLERQRPVPAGPTAGPSTRLRTVAAVAHRGASGHAPENTLAAVRAAVAMGADHVEVDVHRTRDGALVVLHDATASRTTDARTRLPGRAPWRVADLTYDELRLLDAGGWHSPRHAGEPVPLLAEVVDLLAATGTGLLLEVKSPQLYPGIEADLAAEVRGVPGLVVQSFDHAAMARFKALAPEVPVGLLGAPPRRRLGRLALWADQVNPRHAGLAASYVDAVHDAGMACQVWTVNQGADMARVLTLGVDGVITNYPDVLARLLDAPAVL